MQGEYLERGAQSFFQFAVHYISSLNLGLSKKYVIIEFSTFKKNAAASTEVVMTSLFLHIFYNQKMTSKWTPLKCH
jgi:hypothetical protein